VSGLVEFLSVGHQVARGLQLTCVERSAPDAAALYARRLEALRLARAPYVCWVDGYGDRLLPGFAAAMQALAATGRPLGYAAELVSGRRRPAVPWSLAAYLADPTVCHHGVVCRREALLAIDWPAGCHHWETIAYGTLGQQGTAFDPVPRYDWRPGSNGARLWDSTRRAIDASRAWVLASARPPAP
jgi:hypothetical protein